MKADVTEALPAFTKATLHITCETEEDLKVLWSMFNVPTAEVYKHALKGVTTQMIGSRSSPVWQKVNQLIEDRGLVYERKES
jgi:hypothetical protein